MKKLEKNNDAITLIALIITIIILLILSGVTISTLTENGLFEKAKQANEKYSISQVKEKLNIKIMEFKASSTDNETLEQFRDYLAEDVSNNVYKIEEIYTNDDSTGVIEELYVTDVESGYTFAVDNEFNILGPIESNYKTEAIYEIISSDETKYKILVSIKNIEGIQKITCPNGNIIEGNNKSNISIDYEIEDNNQYEFVIQTQDNEEIFILDSNEINNITISETTSYAYPIITEYGIEIGKNINIEYSQSENNYYSIDDGNTWIKYNNEEIRINKAVIIKTKSIGESNKITQIISKKIEMELADDALSADAYDEDTSTMSSGIIYVDSALQTKDIILYGNELSDYSYIKFIDENEQVLYNMNVYYGGDK